VAGASAYPRVIDFGAFRSIADEVGAVLVADIAHMVHAHPTVSEVIKFAAQDAASKCGL